MVADFFLLSLLAEWRAHKKSKAESLRRQQQQQETTTRNNNNNNNNNNMTFTNLRRFISLVFTWFWSALWMLLWIKVALLTSPLPSWWPKVGQITDFFVVVMLMVVHVLLSRAAMAMEEDARVELKVVEGWWQFHITWAIGMMKRSMEFAVIGRRAAWPVLKIWLMLANSLMDGAVLKILFPLAFGSRVTTNKLAQGKREKGKVQS
jgi:FtsH-binding integral membrane protein